jgi:hypothetical protein
MGYDGGYMINQRQREPDEEFSEKVLQRAVEQGYFENPRRTTLVRLADQFGIETSTASEELRTGILDFVKTQRSIEVQRENAGTDSE